jgi:hypothetical protein
MASALLAAAATYYVQIEVYSAIVSSLYLVGLGIKISKREVAAPRRNCAALSLTSSGIHGINR